MSRRVLVIVPVLGAVALLAAFGASALTAEGDYTAENVRILRETAGYPGARAIGTSTRPYDRGWLPRSSGYVTEATFELEEPAAQRDLAAHYRHALDADWAKLDDGDCEGYVRGDAVLLFSPDVFQPRYFNVIVDAHGRSHCSEFMSVLRS
jgi:hypothetical protein